MPRRADRNGTDDRADEQPRGEATTGCPTGPAERRSTSASSPGARARPRRPRRPPSTRPIASRRTSVRRWSRRTGRCGSCRTSAARSPWSGMVTNVDVNDGPHPKNIRGELGKAMNHWYTKTVAKDPLMRATDNSHAADKRNFLTTYTNAASKGVINPKRPRSSTRRRCRSTSRRWRSTSARTSSASRPPTRPSCTPSGSRYVQDGEANDTYQSMTPDALAKRFPFVIQATVAWDHDTLQAHRHHIGDMSYHHSSMRARDGA